MMRDTTSMHIGRKITRIRELRGIKQEALARELGMSHQAGSKLEQSEQVDDERLKVVAEKLGVNVEIIKNFNEDAAINLINNIHDNKFDNYSNAMVYQQILNPIERLLEVMEENKKLYERLLQAEKEKNQLLEKMLELSK